ncbi:hypothetical protein HZA86_02560 [Candidatus Uhrbacteria bacterium]|nr:hypothetical protein [Candidatus Uhrbacteria bacterium]
MFTKIALFALVALFVVVAPVAAQPPYNPYSNYGYGGGYYGGNYGGQSKFGEILGGIAQITAARNIGRAEREAARAQAEAYQGQYYGPEAQAKADRIRAMTAQEARVSDAAADRTLAGADLTYDGAVTADGGSSRSIHVSGGAPIATRRYMVERGDSSGSPAPRHRFSYGQAITAALDRLQNSRSGSNENLPAPQWRFLGREESGHKVVSMAGGRPHEVASTEQTNADPPPKPAPKKKKPAKKHKPAAPAPPVERGEGRSCDPYDEGDEGP